MKRTALILAGAAAFDLGAMVVVAQAQQQGDIPPTRNTVGSTMGGLLPGLAVQDPTGTGGCVLRPGQTVPGGTGGPCGSAAVATGEWSPHIKMDTTDFIKIDRVNTIQSCRARQGEVVRHQGVQQCRLPAAVPPPGNPRPGASPPRN